MLLALSIIIGIIAALWDGFTIQNGRVNHFLHSGARVAALAIAIFFTVGFGWDSISYLALMGIFFRLALNFFIGKPWDFLGTTAYYDRFFNWLGKGLHGEPGQLTYAIEIFVMAICFMI